MNTLRGYGHMTIGGAVRPFHVGTNQTAIFCDLRKMDLAEYNDMFASLLPSIGEDGEVIKPKRQNLSMSELRDFIYSSLAAGAQNDRLPVEFDAATVGNWIDDADAEDEIASKEVGKPINMHLELMQQRIERQLARLQGNAPAPQLTVSKGGAQKQKKITGQKSSKRPSR